MTSGEPSGLRVSDWKTAPDAPSAAPNASAASTRGSRQLEHDRRGEAVAGRQGADDLERASAGSRRARARRPRRRRDQRRRRAIAARRCRRRRGASAPRRTSDGARVDAGAHRALAGGGGARSRSARVRRRAAVTSPAASSPGGATTRPTTSASSSSTGPAGPLTADGPRLARRPTTPRATCATISPRNAIGPTTAVAPPASRVTTTRATTRTVGTETPTDEAWSSPRATASSGREATSATTTPATTKGATGRDGRPAAVGERADLPRADGVEAPRVGEHDGRGDRRSARRRGRRPASVRRAGLPPDRPAPPISETATVGEGRAGERRTRPSRSRR